MGRINIRQPIARQAQILTVYNAYGIMRHGGRNGRYCML